MTDPKTEAQRHPAIAGRETIISEPAGWGLFLGSIAATIAVLCVLGTLLGPTKQATIAHNVEPDGVVTGVGNTPAP
jgi:hypothetical protein